MPYGYRGWDRDYGVSEYLRGRSANAIARELGCSAASLRREVARRDIPRWRKGMRIRVPVLMPADLAERGYIAGMLDGEGTIRWKPDPMITINNTHRGVIEWLHRVAGGSVYWRERGATATGYIRKPSGVWQCTGVLNTYTMLTTLLPFLIIKRDLAEGGLRQLEERYATLTRREQRHTQ